MTDDDAATAAENNRLQVEDDMLSLPEPYASADQLVVRQRDITQDWASYPGLGYVPWVGRDPPDDEAQNPGLDADEVLMKEYGQDDPERFRVEIAD